VEKVMCGKTGEGIIIEQIETKEESAKYPLELLLIDLDS